MAVQTKDDTAIITATALDYIEGWYEGDPDRMERALHPDLAKRIVRAGEGPGGSDFLGQMSAMGLVRRTRGRADMRVSAKDQERTVTILDRFANAASVKIVANDWIDYLHIAKFDGDWVIVNVLWEMKPKNPDT